jgi:hypothetical protein
MVLKKIAPLIRYIAQQLHKRHKQITTKVKKCSHISGKNTGPYHKQQPKTHILVEVIVNRGTPYKITWMTRFSRNQDWTSMANANEHLNLTKIYQLQRITFSADTRWQIVKNENTWKMHDKWELYWQKMYKHSLLHHTSRIEWSWTTWQVCKCTILITSSGIFTE